MRKLLTTHGVRLLLAFLCIVAGWTTAKAATWTVAGSSANLFGSTWSPSTTSNDMTLQDGLYVWQKTVSGAQSFEFKICKNHDWAEAYPAQNYQYSNTKTGSYKLTITFNESTHAIEVIAGDPVYSVAGDPASVFGASWSETNTSTEMTLSNGVYTWTSSEFTGVSNISFKVVKNHSWTNSWPESNYTLSPVSSKTYTLTVTYNASSNAVTGTLNEVSTPDPNPVYTVALVGNGIGVGSPSNAVIFDNNGDGTYSKTISGCTSDWIKLSIASGANVNLSTWDNFNAHLYGSGNLVSGDNNLSTASAGNMYLPVTGTVTLTISDITSTSCVLNVSGGTVATHDYSIAGNNADIFGASWTPSNTSTDMTLSSGTTYTWTSGEFAYNGEIQFKIIQDHTTYIAPSSNYVINNGNSGDIYTLTVTYDSSNGDVTGTLNFIRSGVIDPAWYLVTEASGWDASQKIAFTANNGTFTLTQNNFSGKFKLINELGDWYGWESEETHTITRDYPTVALTQGGMDNHFNLATAANYTFTISGSNLTVSGFPAPVYSVAGDSIAIFGGNSAWDAANTATNMTLSNGVYTWTSGNFTYVKPIELKVVVDHSFGEAYPSDNYVVNNGVKNNIYTLTVTFNPTGNVVNATLNLVSEPAKAYYVIGTFNEWNMGTRPRMALNSTTGKYECQFRFNGEFKIMDEHDNYLGQASENNPYTITRDNPTVTLTTGTPNMKLDSLLTYKLSIDPSTNVMTVTGFPERHYYLIGEFNSWNTATKVEIPKSGDNYVLTTQTFGGQFKIMDENGTYLGGNVGDSGDEYFTLHRNYPTATLSTGGSQDHVENFYVAVSHNYSVTINPSTNQITLGNWPGEMYYLVGELNSWTQDDTYKFVNNNGTFTLGPVTFSGEFKIMDNDGNWLGAAGNEVKVITNLDNTVTLVDGQNMKLEQSMAYTLTISNGVLTVTGFPSRETGEMYIIGYANGGTFQANLGTPMEKISDGVYQADNVQLMSGSDFSFTAKLGADAEDWTTANYYRYFNTEGYCIEVMDNQVGSVADNTTGTEFGLQDTGDGSTGTSNFKLKTSGAYRITVNTNTMKVRFEKMYASLYMFGKGFTWGNTTPNAWDPTSAIPMTTTDGKIYHLDAVKFDNVDAAGFIFSKVVAQNNDDGGKQYVARSGFFPSNDYDYVIHKNDQQNDINKALVMVEGSTDDAAALLNFNSHRWTIWGTEVAANNAKYNVVVDIVNKTVTLKENISITNELTIRLEQTDNVIGKNPGVQVWISAGSGDSENPNVTGGSLIKFQGPWVDNAEGSADSPTGLNSVDQVTLDGNMWYKCREYTSYDNRKWWEWEIGGDGFRIGSIHFYRNNSYDDTPADPNGDLSRRSGVLYYTWEERNEIEDHTADYYVDHVKEAPECATMLDDHIYVYFVNTPGWSTVYCHAWDENGNALLPHLDSSSEPAANAGWPGDICQVVGYNEDGFAVYRYDFGLKSLWEGKTIGGVIFNSGPSQGGGPVAEQTGDFTPFKNGASYDYVGRVSLGRSLGNIIAKGVVKGPKYDVEDELVVVYYNPGESGTIEVPYVDEFGNPQVNVTKYTGAYYAKDINNANEKSFNYDGKLDYVFDVTQFTAPKPYINEEGETVSAGSKVELLMEGRTRYDQSNWVRLVKANNYSGTSDWTAGGLVNKKIKGDMLGGQLVDNLNPTMIVEELPADALSATTYVLNDYIAPHFNDNYSVNDNGDLFFVRPKANEVAHITWAVYKGNNEFYTPASWAGLSNDNTADGSETGDMFNHGNAYNLKGGFKVVDWGFAGDDTAADLLQEGEAYQFDAIIRYKDNSGNGAPIISPQGNGGRLKAGARVDYDDDFNVNNSQFEVYPVNVDRNTWVVTGIKKVEADAIAKDVVAVKYFNIMGVEQRELQPGVNIVVTIYNDGSRSSAKVLK